MSKLKTRKLENTDNPKKEVLEVFVKDLKKKCGNKIKKVILFGSVARGDFDKDSDIDVVVIGNVQLEEVIDIAYPILLKYGELISVDAMSEEYYSMLRRERASYIKNIEKEGVIIG